MTHLPSFMLCLAGFTLLALAMHRQQKEIFRRPLGRAATRTTRITATITLLLALSLQVSELGWGLGLVTYSGHTSLAAGIVYCLLMLRARLVARLS